MSWHFDNGRPIYTQLLERVRFLIISGQYPPGSKLPSVRDLASEASVNPNTMQLALAELERSRLICSRFVTEVEEMIHEMKESMGREKILTFFHEMKQMGYDRDQTTALIEKILKEKTI